MRVQNEQSVKQEEDSNSSNNSNTVNENCCKLCTKTFSSSYNPLSWIITESRKCFICDELICIECCSEEEKYHTEKKTKGYACKNCENTTRTSITMPFVDLNPLYGILENQLPNLLDKTNLTISSKLEEIKITIKEQKQKTKDDVLLIINESINNHLYPKLLKILMISFLGLLILSGLITVEILYIIKFFN